MATNRKKKYIIKSKFRFITFIVIVIGLICGTFGIITGLDSSEASTKVEYVAVQIEAGDTLWDIVEEYMDDNTDPREAVYEICRINDIQAADLQPGMVISVPTSI